MRVLVRLACLVVLTAVIGCGGDKGKATAPQNVAPPPTDKPTGTDGPGGSGATAPPVKP